MDKAHLWDHLIEAGVIRLEGQHIILHSGRHTNKYADFDPSNVPDELRADLRAHLQRIVTTEFFARIPYTKPLDAAVVGTGCGYWYAAMLAEELGCRSFLAERNIRGRLEFRRNKEANLYRKRAIIIDDVYAEGETITSLADLTERVGAQPVIAAVLLNRSGEHCETLNRHGVVLPFVSLFEVSMETWAPADCPACKAGIDFSTKHGQGDVEHWIHGQNHKT